MPHDPPLSTSPAPSRPPRKTPAAKKKTAKENDKTQAQLRAELFEDGSDFKRTRRNEIIGIDGVLVEIDEIIHWLKHSEEYRVHQSRLQPGVIFEGDPGTGKTLVSRYIATASDALFINCRDFPHSGSLFKDSDIRDLFRRARKVYKENSRPVVLFWDEFENVAKERGDAGTSPEQEAVVSQLTAELDGVEGKNAGIVLIGCTNYMHGIDSALKRRGRMGLQIEFHAPDRAGKEKILTHYLNTMETEDDIDTETLSYFFDKHATAADIEEACVESWRLAVRRAIEQKHFDAKMRQEGDHNPIIAQADLVQVFIKHLVGPPTTYTIPKDERYRVAVHEVGHAITSLIFGVPLRLITVQPGKKSLGRVMNDDIKEYIGSMDELVDFMRVGMGGIAAERSAGMPIMQGHTSDLRTVNETASHLIDLMVYDDSPYGVGPFNLAAFGDSRKCGYSPVIPYVSESEVERSDHAVRNLVEQVQKDAYRVMDNVGSKYIRQISTRVNDKITMTGQEFYTLFVEITGTEPEAFNYSSVQLQEAV